MSNANLDMFWNTVYTIYSLSFWAYISANIGIINYKCKTIISKHPHYATSKKCDMFVMWYSNLPYRFIRVCKCRKETPQKLTQLSSRSHPRHLVGKRTAQKDITIDTTSDSQVNSNFPNRWSPASLTFNNYFYLFLYLYIFLYFLYFYIFYISSGSVNASLLAEWFGLIP